MEELIQENFDQDDVLDIITDFPLQPLGRRIIITVNTENTSDDLVLTEHAFSQTQYVVATGSGVMDFEPGQKVLLDVEKMMQKTGINPETGEDIYHLHLQAVEVDGKRYGLTTDSYVLCNDNR